ncbi:MAG: sigma-70 family RNA polymerase sigma factor [bacterium]|nr:sigma-70 family RNA polymerase sigma factor [bacterium]
MDSKHFPAFYRKHVKKIYRFLYFRVGSNQERAEDLTQDVFLKALNAFDRYDESISESAWIFTIARNHLINDVSKQKKHSSLEEIENIEMDGESWIVKSENADDVRALIKAMDTLKSDEKDLIQRKYIAGWSFKELAEEMKTTSGALRIKATRTMTKLKKEMNKKVNDT